MKRLFLITSVLFLLLLPSLVVAQEAQPSDENKTVWKITMPAKNIIRIVGCKLDGDVGEAGYGDAFEHAIKLIAKKNKIISIVPINYLSDPGSITKEIYVIVK